MDRHGLHGSGWLVEGNISLVDAKDADISEMEKALQRRCAPCRWTWVAWNGLCCPRAIRAWVRSAREGVFGLRRAFQVVGVRTVIMSLWAVDDEAGRAWMRALYDERLGKGLSTPDALREASLTVLRARRARGQSASPFFWGGFVAAGDWR